MHLGHSYVNCPCHSANFNFIVVQLVDIAFFSYFADSFIDSTCVVHTMQTAQNAPGAPAIRQEVPFFAKLISQEFSLKEAPSVESEDSGNTSLPAVPEASCQISDSVDTSLYKEKLDRLQRLVDQLQDKNRGLEILSACSLEGQQENKKLKSELRYFKSQVAQLQKRLGEVDKGSLDEFLQGVESHCSLPSFSADSFENLLRENVKLKQALRKAESYQRGPGSQVCIGFYFCFTFFSLIVLLILLAIS